MAQIVKAPLVLVARKDLPANTADELIALCKDKLGGVKAPKTVDIVETLPRSPVGKVLKKDLRERYWRDLGRRI